MSIGLWVVIAAVVVALAFGGYRALTDGRFRGTRPLRPAPAESRGSEEPATNPTTNPTTWELLAGSIPQATPGERATLVQFSSAFCAPCRATRRVLSDVAEVVPGVVHLDVDAEQHLDVVRRLDILRTPTTLVLDGAGNEVARAAGAPRKEQVLSVIPSNDPAS